jgi:hypothetical protein
MKALLCSLLSALVTTVASANEDFHWTMPAVGIVGQEVTVEVSYVMEPGKLVCLYQEGRLVGSGEGSASVSLVFDSPAYTEFRAEAIDGDELDGVIVSESGSPALRIAYPTLQIAGGNNQVGSPGALTPLPFTARVLGAGIPAENVTVEFLADGISDGALAPWDCLTPACFVNASTYGTTDVDGYTAVWFRQPTAPYSTTTIWAAIYGAETCLEFTTSNFHDTDKDGLPDEWEATYLGNLTSSPTDDSDDDGLNNAREFQLGTNPTKTDSDSDGMPDGWEVTHGFNPAVNDASGNSDGDAFTNAQEFATGQNPNRAPITDATNAIGLRIYSCR